MANIVLLGSSYISRLERYTGGKLKIPGFVRFLGKGGMRTDTVPDSFMQCIAEIKPDCVIIHLGGNDITCDSNATDIARNLLKLHDTILEIGARKVFVGEIITREPSQRHCPGLTKTLFDVQRRKINSTIKKKLGRKLLRFKDITFPKDYDEDLIHLSSTSMKNASRRSGMDKYFFTLRRKLKTRQTQFEKVKGQYEKSTRKEIRKCLVREATSPEVTDDEDETRRVAVPLVWESTRLRCLKRDLDADYRDALKIQARRQKATVTRSQLQVTRTVPPKNIPEWAISSSYNF